MMEQHERISKGLLKTASLPDIMPDAASKQVSPIYEDIQQRLRVPLVNLIFRTLANYPDYLEQLWKHFAPTLSSISFEEEADSLREKALLEFPFEEAALNVEVVEHKEQLRAFNDTIFYVLPKLLLIATIFDEATTGTIRGRRSSATDDDTASNVPLGAAEGTTKVNMVAPDKASDKVAELFEAIKKKHGHPLVSSYFRGLANWPVVLEKAWKTLSPRVGSPEYNTLRDFLIAQAHGALRRLPLTQPPSLSLTEQEQEDVGNILAAFRYKFIPEMLIDAAFIKALLDGPEEAYSSRFSAINHPDDDVAEA